MILRKPKEKNASACLKEQNEETHEPPSFEIGRVEVVNEDDKNSLPSDSKKYEETSHEYEEFFIENTEDNFETHATLEMKQSIRGNLGSKMGLISKCAKISFCELEFKNQ